MLALLVANFWYVLFRLAVSGNIMLLTMWVLKKWLSERTAWYASVLILAQVSFFYDYFIFGTL